MTNNHWHPCCQETPDVPIDNTRVYMKLESSKPIVGEKNTVLKTEHILYLDTVENAEPRESRCPRGHVFQTKNPLVIAVESNPEYNSGPICGYCLVDWHRNNVNAETFYE